MLYLTEIDSLLELLHESSPSTTTTTATKRGGSSLPPTDVGGRSIPRSDGGEEVRRASLALQKARNLVSERSLSLLP